MKNKPILDSRREFLVKAATAAIASPLLFNSEAQAGSDKLRHACIGVGGMGWGDLQQFKKHPQVEIVALCDVDEKNLQRAAEFVPGARTYTDWRELFKAESKNIDSVNVSVPDHNHFPIAVHAIRNKKHVYCQKPMCHDVAEVRVLTKEAIKARVTTQLGTQIASGMGDRTAVQLIKQGVIGKVKHAYLCSNRPGAVAKYRLVGPRPAEIHEVPAHLHWEQWLGTAPVRPYVPAVYHPAIWRTWQDFGTGWSGDIGCHIFDAVWKGLSMKAPLSVIAEVQQSWKDSPERRADTWPQGNHIIWQFPGNELTESKTFSVEWFDGEFYPPQEIRDLYKDGEYPAESAMLMGTEGALLIPHQKMPVVIPFANGKIKAHTLPTLAERNHYHHFVDACLGGEKTESHFAQSGPMTEAVLLGTIAIRIPDQLLKWDAAKMKFPNYPEAEKYLKRTYREGWEVKSI
ncbi:MAG: Gfo/Idh/MocA family oxidoreductase [Spirosomataceae bacterium]